MWVRNRQSQTFLSKKENLENLNSFPYYKDHNNTKIKKYFYGKDKRRQKTEKSVFVFSACCEITRSIFYKCFDILKI